MSYCRNCGYCLDEGAKFCPNCGTAVAFDADKTAGAAPIYEEPVREEPLHEEPLHEEPFHEEPLREEPVHAAPAKPYVYGTNGLSIAGFICAFFFPFVGLVLSIVALSNAKTGKYEKPLRGLATWGIIVSAIGLALRIVFGIVIGFVIIPLLANWLTKLIAYVTTAIAAA